MRINGKKEESNDFNNLFLRDKPVEMLVLLKRGNGPKYATQVSKGVDCTYSHTIKVLDKFRELGLVQFKKRGRIKLVFLTENGAEIAHDFEGIINKFERENNKIKEMKKKENKKEEKNKKKVKK
ncbi:MarR family transcriptional regulator [bacterium]|nr:MarR family transcriptional regulator [bacterium]